MIKNIVSVWSGMLKSLSPEEAVETYVSLGYKGFELSREHLEMLVERGNPTKTARDFARFVKEREFTIMQAHLPMLDVALSPSAAEYIEEQRRRIDLLLELGVQNIVVHLGKGMKAPPEDMPYDEVKERRINAVNGMVDLFEGTKSFLCVENLIANCRVSSEILDVLQAVNSPHLAVCYDTGHQHENHTLESASHFVDVLGPHIRALHFNDNDGLHEQHLAPYALGLNLPEYGAERLDVDEVLFALKNINYEGLFNLELPGENVCPLEVAKLKLEYYLKLGNYLVDRMNQM